MARIWLAAVFGWNIIRAVTQTVTPGEAWNYDGYIGPPWVEALKQSDGNNHVLNTLLVRISTARIHLTEFSLRLPSLLCGGLYLWAVYRLARRVFGNGLLFLAMVALLTLNPMVLDAMSEARGYGMALAAWIWALELLLESLESFSAAKLNLCGILLGLSVTASLSFAAPALALILMSALYRGGSLAHLPHLAFLTAFCLLIIPLNHVEMSVVTEGAANLRQTLNYLTLGSTGSSDVAVNVVVRIAVALLMAWAIIALARLRGKRASGAGEAQACPTFLLAGTLGISVILLLAANRFAKAAFPEGGAIYMIPILTLLLGLLTAGRKATEVAFLVIAGLGVVIYASQIEMPYRAGRDFVGGRNLAKALRADAGRRTVRVGVSEDAEGILRYYSWRYRQGNWQPIERVRSEASFDYYVLTPRDAATVKARVLRVMYRDPGLILAK
jgi:hypothetical protein